jgi:hypothetical protein
MQVRVLQNLAADGFSGTALKKHVVRHNDGCPSRCLQHRASQTISVLDELRTLTGQFELLFPGVRSPSRPLSENTLNAALRRLGYAKDEMSSHGFRAAASSLLNECGKWNADAIEAQLAHVESNAVRKAYARAEYWAERVEMMAYWADRLDELRRGGIIVPLRA